jgi:hypothetical protein
LIQRKPLALRELRFRLPGAGIPGRMLSKSNRRAIAHIAAVLVLLCQTTALAYACACGTNQPAATMANAPCHNAGESDAQGPAQDAGQPPCLSQISSPSYSALDASVAPVLPLIVLLVDGFGIDSASSHVAEPRLARNTSPPLTILHCCLRN